MNKIYVNLIVNVNFTKNILNNINLLNNTVGKYKCVKFNTNVPTVNKTSS